MDLLHELEARLRIFEDRDAIWRVLMDYRRHLNTRNWDAYSRLFSEDGTWTGKVGHAQGPTAIREMLTEAMEPLDEHEQTVHLVCNPVIDVDGDRATAETTWCYLTRDADDNPKLSMVGRYSDVLHRTDDGWKFASRMCAFDIPFERIEQG
jgi:uncharacterized protein (TIGR02246 family)